MSFKIQKAETITARMVAWLSGLQNVVTDFIPGSLSRTKLEAVAVEIEAITYQFYVAIRKAIPTAIYRAFDFSALPAVRASGDVRFSAQTPPAEDVTIPKGARVATVGTQLSPEKVYETTIEATLSAGQSSVDVPVSALTPGEAGNTGGNTITVIKSVIAGIDEVTNPNAIVNGAPRESEDDRRLRFLQYISSLMRGTETAIEYGAKTAEIKDGNGNVIERCVDAMVVDMPGDTAGFADCYIYNGESGTSAALVDEAQKIIDGYVEDGEKVAGYKAAGVVVTVSAATDTVQNVTIDVEAFQTASASEVEQRVADTIVNYVSGLGIGEKLLYNEIIERAMGINGVYNVSLSVPAGDVTPAINEVLIIGTVTVTVTQ